MDFHYENINFSTTDILALPMIVSLAVAAKLTGKSRQTIYRKANKGELSTTIRDDNSKGVDTSELERVFGSITVQEVGVESITVSETETEEDTSEIVSQPETVDVTSLESELVTARTTIRMHEERLEELHQDKSKLWDLVESQRLLLERREQPAKPVQPQQFTRPTRVSKSDAFFSMAGIGIGGVIFLLSSTFL